MSSVGKQYNKAPPKAPRVTLNGDKCITDYIVMKAKNNESHKTPVYVQIAQSIC